MNMFRNLFTLVLFALGIGLFVSDPTTWLWVDRLGPQAVETVRFLGEAKPFSYLLMWVVAVALFITRKQF